MTLAADVLNTYARDWQIDETPILPGSGPLSLLELRGASRWYSSFFPLIATYAAGASISPDQFSALDAVTPAPSEIRSLVRFSGSYDPHEWTSATMETSARVSRLLKKFTQDLEHPPHTLTYFPDRPVEEPSWRVSVAPPVDYEDVPSEGASSERPGVKSNNDRAQRAIEAVKDLARWLGTTETYAAELSGGYRRSYYNWLKGRQPYPATTLNLFEAHALVAALVDAIGERGARNWLCQAGTGEDRRAMLGTEIGRIRLSEAASSILFRPQRTPVWSPDDDAEHEPVGHADPSMFSAAVAPPPPPQQER